MEPRVYNLLLSDLPSERHGIEHLAVHFPSSAGAVFPSNTLPAIRPLHEDQSLESRDYRNQIDSLQLPEIDWQALTSPVYPPPPTSSNLPAAPSRAEEQQQLAKKPTKSAPLAEVLNSVSPEARNIDPSLAFHDSDRRKRRRIDAPGTRILPKPSPTAKKGSKRHLLPPLLVPLHEPPPDARIIPSITTDGFRERMGDIPSRKPKAVDQETTTPPQPTPTEANGAPVTAKVARHAKGRNKWTEEETTDLLRGVAKFGIGNWKKILQYSDYHFNGRTAVDLKDRFRTCCPDDYRNAAAERIQDRSKPTGDTGESSSLNPSATPTSVERPSELGRKLPEDLARLGISGPFPKSRRRARRGFAPEEDEAILRGFEKYGAQWTKIRSDQDLGLSSRSRTDLRDRFRNKYPDKFVEAGHKFKLKDTEQSKDAKKPTASETNKQPPEEPPATSRPDEQDAHSSVDSSTTLMAPPLSASKDRAQHSLKLLTASISDPYFAEFGDLTPDDDDPETITLSRNIFEWADQYSRVPYRGTGLTSENQPPQQPQVQQQQQQQPQTEPSSTTTITSIDQFNINPMLALKVPSQSSGGLHGGSSSSAVPNQFPPLPLSGILNGPVSLPPPADLVSGHDAEGSLRIEG